MASFIGRVRHKIFLSLPGLEMRVRHRASLLRPRPLQARVAHSSTAQVDTPSFFEEQDENLRTGRCVRLAEERSATVTVGLDDLPGRRLSKEGNGVSASRVYVPR